MTILDFLLLTHDVIHVLIKHPPGSGRCLSGGLSMRKDAEKEERKTDGSWPVTGISSAHMTATNQSPSVSMKKNPSFDRQMILVSFVEYFRVSSCLILLS
jgi:hypothetical protein